MSNLDRSRKLFIRSLLAGTSTLATLIGAQSLAMMDSQAFEATPVEDVVIELTTIPTLMILPTTASTTLNSQPIATVEPVLLKVEPSITIFRQAGSVNETTSSQQNESPENIIVASNSNPLVIAPPNPVVLQAPDPIVIVEAPVVIQQQVQQQPAPQQQQQPTAQKNNNSKKSKSGSSK